jgi:predicted amino acid dehydrogenase
LTRFAFVIHPLTARDAARKWPWAKVLPDRVIERFMQSKSPMVLSEITGIESLTGAKTSGVFIGLPMTARQLLDPSLNEFALAQLVKCAELAERHDAKVMGLGAFSAIAGDAGITLARHSPIAITTGNSYTVATAIEGTLKACGLVEIDPSRSTLAVVGATGSIGKTCAKVLSRTFRNVILVGRDKNRTHAIAQELSNAEATTDLSRLEEADAVVTVTSSDSAVIHPHHLQPGVVVCDVSRPRDVSVLVARSRPDVLVIEGGVVKVPGPVSFGFDFGFPPGTAYACMSETMLLALENRIESYTLGKDVAVEQVDETLAWAGKHGFSLAGFRSFEREVTLDAIERAKSARSKRTFTPEAAPATA